MVVLEKKFGDHQTIYPPGTMNVSPKFHKIYIYIKKKPHDGATQKSGKHKVTII